MTILNPPSPSISLEEVKNPTLPEADASLAAAPPLAQAGTQKHKHRTLGLGLFDIGLYPIFTNLGVFLISVGATYLTSRGSDRNAQGKLIFGKIGEKFAQRGEWIIDKFKRVGMTHEQADMSKMVLFSFVDGSLLAPVVKLTEDKREPISYGIDKFFGTVPEDKSVYDAEPKQSWVSVLGGRLATCLIVVPTAVMLDKTGLNNRLFSESGRKIAQFITRKPNIARHFHHFDIAELSKVGVFEAFYTSVCTAGLYFSSRLLASLPGKKKTTSSAEDGNLTLTPPVILAQPEDIKDDAVASPSSKTITHKAHKHMPKPQFTDRALPPVVSEGGREEESMLVRASARTVVHKAHKRAPRQHFTEYAQHSEAELSLI